MSAPFEARRAQLQHAVERGDRAKEILDLVDRLETAMAAFDEEPGEQTTSKPPIGPCVQCGGPLPARKPGRGNAPTKFCSDTCRLKDMQARRVERRRAARREGAGEGVCERRW